MSDRLHGISQQLNRRKFEPPKGMGHEHLFAFSHAVLHERLSSTPPGPISFMVNDIMRDGQDKYGIGSHWWTVTGDAVDMLRRRSVLVTGVVVTQAALVVQFTYYDPATFARAGPCRGRHLFCSGGVSRWAEEDVSRCGVALAGAVCAGSACEVLCTVDSVQYEGSAGRGWPRTNISRSFLQAAGARLATGDAAFTYEFEDRVQKEKKRCSQISRS